MNLSSSYISPPPSVCLVIFLPPCRKRAERRAVARAAAWRSWRTSLTRTAPEARVSTHTRSTTSENTSRHGSVPFCLKLPSEWKRSRGTPTPTHEPGETTTQKQENDSSHVLKMMNRHLDMKILWKCSDTNIIPVLKYLFTLKDALHKETLGSWHYLKEKDWTLSNKTLLMVFILWLLHS